MKSRAFTLIELLIVVLIIAILAAIAVPNFLEFQVRAKISRVKSDMRSVATAIEAYRIDNNQYPQSAIYVGTSFFNGNAGVRHPRGWVANIGGCILVTTPISYITQWPQTTFPHMEPVISSTAGTSFITEVRGRPEVPMWYENITNQSQPTIAADSYRPGDKLVEFNLGMKWFVCTPGPKATTDAGAGNSGVNDGWYYEPRETDFPTFLKPYDPTNGTVSAGSIHRYGPGDNYPYRSLQ